MGKMGVLGCAVKKVLSAELLCVTLLICGRGWEKCKEVLGVALLVLGFLDVGGVMGILSGVERAGGRVLSGARGGEWARRTSRRGRSARHPDERLGGEKTARVGCGVEGRGGTSGATWRVRGGVRGRIKGGGRKDLVRWEHWERTA